MVQKKNKTDIVESFLQNGNIFKKFVEDSVQALGMADLKGNITYANQKLCSLLDETPKSIIGKNVIDYYSSEHQKYLKNKVLPTVMKKGNFTENIPLLSRKGKEHQVMQSLFLIKGKDGKPHYFANVITDICEMVDTQKLLVKQKDQIDMLFNNSATVNVVLDLTGKIIRINKPGAKLLGYSIKDIIGKNMSKYLTVKSSLKTLLLLNNVVLGKKDFIPFFETEVKSKKGDIFKIAWHSSFVEIDNKKYIMNSGVVSTNHSIKDNSLVKLEAGLTQISEATDDALWLIDIKNYKVLYCNNAYERIFGRKVKDLYADSKNWIMGVHPDDRNRVTKIFYNAKRTKKCDDIFRVQKPDGEIRWVDVRGRLVYGEDGKATGIAGSTRDITASRNVEEEHDIYLKSFEASPDAKMLVTYVDKKPEIVKINKAFTDLFGYTSKQAIGDTPRIIKSGDFSSGYYKDMWKDILNPNKGYFSGEMTNRSRDKKLVHTIQTINTIFNEERKAQSFVSSYVDITQRVEAQKTLASTHAFWTGMINSVEDVFYAFDDKGALKKWNTAYETVTGYSGKELSNMNAMDVIEPSERPKLHKAMKEVYETGFISVESYFRTKQGDKIPFLLSGNLQKDEEGKTLLVGIGKNITARKKLEERLKIYLKGFEKSPNSKALVEYINGTPSIVKINDAFTEYYGYTEKEAIGKSPVILNAKTRPRGTFTDVWKAILDPKIGYWQGEVPNRHKDGTIIYVILTIRTLFDKAGNVSYFLADHIDVTPRIVAENELQKKLHEAEIFTNIAVGRELRMVELKKKIGRLEIKLSTKNAKTK